MFKYIKQIPIIIFPYLYLLALILLTASGVQSGGVDFILRRFLTSSIIIYTLSLIIAVFNAINTACDKYSIITATKINMITKFTVAPAYAVSCLIIFIRLLLGVVDIPVIILGIIACVLSIILTCIGSIGINILFYKKKHLKNDINFLCLVGSFIFAIDLVVAFFYFFRARTVTIVAPTKAVDISGGFKSKYPILLVHGMGFRDRELLNYWGRIPATLEAHGYKVYHGKQDANGTVDFNAKALKEEIERICEEDCVQKFNVIAHSKGGLDMRYAISKLGIGDKIASLTTVNTPHNGSITLDYLTKIPQWMLKFGCKITDIGLTLLGDSKPNTYKIINSFRNADAKAFNEEVVDDPRVYYQSYALVMSKRTSDMVLWLPHLVVNHYEGENDGLLTPDSVKWGKFRGIYRGTTNRGVSHVDQIDMRRNHFTKKQPKNANEISDITLFYLDVVKELVEKRDF